tara:strand:- start:31 stop:240 length:210 start_codon:yes stop_codon:yes gene_type:complete
MNEKITNSIKSGIGSYVLLISMNYIIFLLSGWSIMDEMIPGLNKDFFAVSIFLFLILFVTDYFFYRGKY